MRRKCVVPVVVESDIFVKMNHKGGLTPGEMIVLRITIMNTAYRMALTAVAGIAS